LNIYSGAKDAFDEDAVRQGTLLAAQCSLLVSTHLAADRSDNLVKALGSNREIGMAMGVLMGRCNVTPDEAFAMLRRSSQDANRKLSEVAADVVDTGELPGRP
jgi:AmiR/NasT family two-component response regulator